MEAHAPTALTHPERRSPVARVGASARKRPALVLLGLLLLIGAVLVGFHGLQDVAQRTVNGTVSGSYYALGAVGLTLVYGILKLVNFAHGDMLTFGAYIAFAFNVSIGMPILPSILIAVALTAALGVSFELAMWRPMRKKGAGLLQLLLMAIGLAFVIRNTIQLFASTEQRVLDVDRTSTVEFIGLRIGQTQLAVVITGVVVLGLIALMLKLTSLGRQMRALSDNFALAETTGIDTNRIVIVTWVFAGGLAGLAGVLYAAAIGSFTPNLGFFLLLSLFAAVILGGIGNAYGALIGGLVLGVAQEWSTLLFESRWKLAVGFVILILVLVVRPQGLFGREQKI